MKSNELAKIADEIRNCRECKVNKSGLPVPGEGNSDTKIVFVGEAPGKKESETGRPFVGRAGKLLTQLLDSIRIKRERIFITSPVKYYPGKRTPTTKEIQHGREHLVKQLNVIKPKIIVTLGNVALKALFPDKKLNITKIHGKFIQEDDRVYFPTFHPAAALRFPKIKKLMEKDFKKIQKFGKKKEKLKESRLSTLLRVPSRLLHHSLLLRLHSL